MNEPGRRKYRVRIAEVHRLQRKLGLTDERLALDAGISKATLDNWRHGKPAFLSRIKKVAAALGGVPIVTLIEGPGQGEIESINENSIKYFEKTITIKGLVSGSSAHQVLIRLMQGLTKFLSGEEIAIMTFQESTSVFDYEAPPRPPLEIRGKWRILQVMTGKNADNVKYWAILHIKPEMYQRYAEAVRDGSLTFDDFSRYGEVYSHRTSTDHGFTEVPSREEILRATDLYDIEEQVIEQALRFEEAERERRAEGNGSFALDPDHVAATVRRARERHDENEA